jgi:hypothetical protein
MAPPPLGRDGVLAQPVELFQNTLPVIVTRAEAGCVQLPHAKSMAPPPCAAAFPVNVLFVTVRSDMAAP